MKSDELVHRVLDLVDRYNRRSVTILGSGKNTKLLRQLIAKRMQEDPAKGRFLTYASFKERVRTYIYFYTGLLPFVDLDFDAFSIPLATSLKQRQLTAEKSGITRRIGVRLSSGLLKAPTLWEQLRRRGIVVTGFVLNDQEEWAEVEGWPLDGIMTDDPIAYQAFRQQ